MNTYWQIIIAFARAGLLGYGGGPAVIPLIEYEAVKNYKWMTSDEFGDALALANTLPGPITTKMAAHIGYKVKGVIGAFVAIMAHILPSLIALIGLLSILHSFRSSPVVSGMVQGVTPVIAVMLAVMAYDFLNKASKGLGYKWAIVIAIFCYLLIEVLFIHPGIVIALFLSTAFACATYKIRKINEKKTNEKREVN